MSRNFRCYILYLHDQEVKVVQECLDGEDRQECNYESSDILNEIGTTPRPTIENVQGRKSGLWYYKVNKGKTHMLFVSKDTEYKYVNIFFTKLISLVAGMDLNNEELLHKLRAKSFDLLQVFDTECQSDHNTSSLGLQAAVNSGVEVTDQLHNSYHEDGESMSFVHQGTQLSSVPVIDQTNTSTETGFALKICLGVIGVIMIAVMVALISSGTDDQ